MCRDSAPHTLKEGHPRVVVLTPHVRWLRPLMIQDGPRYNSGQFRVWVVDSGLIFRTTPGWILVVVRACDGSDQCELS